MSVEDINILTKLFVFIANLRVIMFQNWAHAYAYVKD